MIPFNKPAIIGKEINYIKDSIKKMHTSGDGYYTKKCNEWFEKNYNSKKVLLTTSGTHALELAGLLIDLKPGDEVIMTSFTFVSTANAFVLRGAKIIFVDIRPDTMNIDEKLIEQAITKKTKAIVVVHYAGVSCEMDAIMKIAGKYNLYVIEDAAQAIMSKYNDKYCGTIGHFGCISFHETKNINCGEGGALIINDEKYFERAEIIREKGTNRSKFWRGQVDKYTWVDIGSSFLPSDMNAAYLFAQFENCEKITRNRLKSWSIYNTELSALNEKGLLELPVVPKECQHNGHIFFIKVSDIKERTKLIKYLSENNINSVFHYIPLHSSPAGMKYTSFHGYDYWTTKESERLLRLPMYYGLKNEEVNFICKLISLFYNK